MNPKLQAWFELKGRRLVELKLQGGMDFFKTGHRDLTKLTAQEWAEFFTLTGQMDGVLWALQPTDPNEISEFYESVKQFISKLEDEVDAIVELTGKVNLPKGRA